MHLIEISYCTSKCAEQHHKREHFTKVSVFVSVQEKTVEVNDWRKNVEAMSGMEGRKKMFDAAMGQNQ